MLLVKENIELAFLRLDPSQSVSISHAGSVPTIDVQKARSLYLDIADAIWQTQNSIYSMTADWPLPHPQHIREGGTTSSFLRETCLVSCTNNSTTTPMTDLTTKFVCEKWMSMMARLVGLRFLMYRLIFHCSSSQRPPDAHMLSDERSILSTIDIHCRALGDANSTFLQQEDARTGNKPPVDNIANVKEIVNKLEESLLDAILFGWAVATQIHSSAAGNSDVRDGVDPIVLWSDMQSPVVHLLNSVVVGYYNRVVSLIGGQVDQKNFEMLAGNQSKLDLITFVITNDDMLVEYARVVLNSMGLVVEPLPKLSLTLNIDALLSRFAAVIASELSVYISRIVSSEHGSNTCSLVRSVDGVMQFTSPWEGEAIGGRAVLGPVPQLVHAICLTFLEMSKPPHAGIPLESRKKVYAMNSIVSHSVMGAYGNLVSTYSDLLSQVHDELDTLLEGREVVVGDALNNMITFICSVANDTDRLSKDFIPQILNEGRYYLGCGEVDRQEADFALVRDYLASLTALDTEIANELMFVSWTAIEQLVKVIFMDMREEFIVKFDGIWAEDESVNTLGTILRTLSDYLQDFSISLTSQNYLMLILSCGHKLVQR